MKIYGKIITLGTPIDSEVQHKALMLEYIGSMDYSELSMIKTASFATSVSFQNERTARRAYRYINDNITT